MRPKFQLLDRLLVARILSEALALLESPGVKVGSTAAADLLTAAGARVENRLAHIPESLVQKCLRSAPREFFLYDRAGNPAVHYGGDAVQFDPGSSCLNILD